jgi:CRP-like cAMP-binding protein
LIERIGESGLPTVQNHLIERLPRRDRTGLLTVCEEVELVMAEVLCTGGTATRHAYFPTTGFISLITPIEGRPILEVGMVGREGMLGAQLVLGVRTTPLQALVQGAGTAWRVSSVQFSKQLRRSEALRNSLDRYVYVMMIQLASSAACLRYHQIGQRLARWLLMTQDRAYSDRFHVTHEFLAFMLGVRRAGVTTAAVALQRLGMIEYRRGQVTVTNRPRLEAAACSCYAADAKAYRQIMH